MDSSVQNPRIALIKAAAGDLQSFEAWTERFSNKDNGGSSHSNNNNNSVMSADATSLMAAIDTAAAGKFFAGLAKHITTAFERIEAHVSAGGDGENVLAPMSTNNNNNSNGGESLTTTTTLYSTVAGAFRILRTATILLSAYAEEQGRPLPRSFMEAAQILHNGMYAMLGCWQSLGKECELCMNLVVKLCEKLFQTRADIAAPVLPLAVVQLLIQANHPLEKGEGILKRLWAMRSAFAEFDYEDESSDSLRECMLRSFTSPRFLSTTTGRSLLGSFMGSLSPFMAESAHSTIKAQFPLSVKTQEWYGAVYVRAWEECDTNAAVVSSSSGPSSSSSSSSSSLRTQLEMGPLTDLLHRAVHAGHPETFTALRRIFSHFLIARDRKRKGMDALLQRVCAPVLWRALTCTNAVVRRNAATLFRDAFPIGVSECPGGAPERDALITQQLAAVCTLSEDDCPSVREIAVGFMGMVLERFWEMLPTASRLSLLQRLTRRAEDAAAPGIRVAALKSIATLIDKQPLCHGDLLSRNILPPLCMLIHDRVERVRVAAVKLLNVMDRNHGLLGAPLGKHVPVDEVMARLVLDAHTPAVAEGIVPLLVRSFFPPEEAREKEGLGSASTAAARRIVEGLKAWELATLTFVAYVPRFPSFVSRKLMVDTMKKLHTSVHKVAVECAAANKEVDDAAAVGGGGGGGGGGAATAADNKRTKRGRATGDDVAITKAADGSSLHAAEHAARLKLVSPVLRAISTMWNGLEAAMGDYKSTSSSSSSSTSSSSSNGNAGNAGLVDEDASLRTVLVTAFGGGEIAYLLNALTGSGDGDASSSGSGGDNNNVGVIALMLEKNPGAHVHLAAVTSSLLSIAGHLPSSAVTGLSASLWSRLLRMTPRELGISSNSSSSSSSALAGIVNCLCAWGRGVALLDAATTTLSGISNVIDAAYAGQIAAAPKSEAEMFLLGKCTLHPLVAVAALELTMVYASNIPAIPSSSTTAAATTTTTTTGKNSKNSNNSNESIVLSSALLVETSVIDVMTPLARMMQCLHSTIISSGGADGHNGAIAKMIADLAPASVRVWSRLTVLQLQALANAAVVGSGAAADGGIDEAMMTVAESNVGDSGTWALNDLLPALIMATSSNNGTASAALAPLQAAGASILCTLVSLASDLLSAGMAVDGAYALFHGLTSTAPLTVHAMPGLDVSEGSIVATTPLEFCSLIPAGTDQEEEEERRGEKNENNSSGAGSSSSSSSMYAFPRLHVALVRLGLRLFSAAHGNIVATYIDATSIAAGKEPRTIPLQLPSGGRYAVSTTLATLLTSGAFSVSVSNSSTEGAVVAAEAARQLLADLKRVAVRGGEKLASTALSALLSQATLPTFEAAIPSSTMSSFIGGGVTIALPSSLGCAIAPAFLSACTSLGAGGGGGAAAAWAGAALAEALAARLRLLTSISGTTSSSSSGTSTSSSSSPHDEAVMRCLALISASVNACMGPNMAAVPRAMLAAAITETQLHKTTAGKAVLEDLAVGGGNIGSNSGGAGVE